MSKIYVKHFELAATDQERVAYAFAVLERARGRVLRDVIEQVSASEVTRRRSEEYVRLQRQLSRLQRSLLKLRNPKEREIALQQIWEVEQHLIGAEVQIRTWKGPRSQAVSLEALRAGLVADQVLVEYVWGKQRVYAMTISRNQARITPLAERAHVERLLAAYFELLQAGTDSPKIRKAANSLYSGIVAPLRVPASTKKIVIVPDGPLHTLPFDMLSPANRSKVGEAVAITVAPSASIFHSLRSREAVAKPLPLLAVGGVPYTDLPKRGNPSRATSIFDARIKPDLEPLPASATEVEMALRMTGSHGVGLVGQGATESRFKQQPLEDFRVIHLAVHAFADPKQPQRAALLFASEKSPHEDGFLQPREIVRLPLKADLVILSACNTTVGRPLGQEGVSNLARAFLAAGANAVLTTSWSVADTASGSPLAEFYSSLQRGKSVALALRGKAHFVAALRSECHADRGRLPSDREWGSDHTISTRPQIWGERNKAVNLSREQMTGILGNIQHHIETRFFNPLADITGWTAAWNEQRSSLLTSASSAEFEQRINTVLGAEVEPCRVLPRRWHAGSRPLCIE